MALLAYKDGKFATLTFNQAFLAQASSKAPSTFGQLSQGMSSVPPSMDRKARTRGMIQRNPKTAAIPTPSLAPIPTPNLELVSAPGAADPLNVEPPPPPGDSSPGPKPVFEPGMPGVLPQPNQIEQLELSRRSNLILCLGFPTGPKWRKSLR
jgi:hypothetical protein